MRQSLKLLATLFLLLLISCEIQVEDEYIKPDSVYKDTILEYLTNYKDNVSKEAVNKIEELSVNLDFKETQFYELNTGQQVLIANIKQLKDLQSGKLYAVFSIERDQIINARIASFQDSGTFNYYSLLKAYIEDSDHPYSGKTNVYDLYQNLSFFNEYESGQVKVHGSVKPGSILQQEAKTAGCTDWYLVTTYYYSDGSTSRNEAYLYTTCECLNSRVKGIECGGSGGGGSGSGGSTVPPASLFPSNPVIGQEVSYTDSDGVYRRYQWQCNSQGCLWAVVETKLPNIVVVADRDAYYFLPVNPVPKFFFGPDNLVYRFNFNWDQWHGTGNEVQPTTTPCIQAKQLAQNQEFINKMNDIKSKTNLDYETGYTIVKNPDGTYSYTQINGSPNAGAIEFEPSSAIDGYIHTHYTGLLSIFSPDDIRAMSILYNANLMSNYTTFFAGVVTASGTTYLLMIDNQAQFESFSEQYLEDDIGFGLFGNIYDGIYQIKKNNTIENNEKGFLQLLNSLNTGLKLLKGDTNTFNKWSQKGLDPNSNITSINCN